MGARRPDIGGHAPLPPRAVRPWVAAALASVAIFTAIDLAVAGTVVIAGVLVGPFLAARAGRTETLALALIAVTAAIATGLTTASFESDQRLASTLIAVVGSLIAVWTAGLREAREVAIGALEVQHAVARVAAAAGAEDAAPRMLAAIGPLVGGEIGELWEPGGDGELHRTAFWSAAGEPEAVRVEATLAMGEGIPGRVLATGRPLVVADIQRDPIVVRRDEAARAGLHSAIAFPAMSGSDVIAVVLFLSREPHKTDPDLLDQLETVGVQLGQYLEVKHAAVEVRQSRDRLDAILGSLADGVTVQTRTGEIVYANEAVARTLGFETVDEVVSAPPSAIVERFEIFDEDGAPLAVERLPARRAFRGEAAEPMVLRFRVRATGEERWAIVKSTPLADNGDDVAMAVNIFEDITDLKRGEISQRFLAESGRLLAASLDYEETLRAVARLAVPSYADWCAVDLVEDSHVERVAIAHADPERLAFAAELQSRYPPDPHAEIGVPQVARSGVAELYPEIPDELLEATAHDEVHLELIRSIGLCSAMIVPIPGRNGNLGAMTFVNAENRRSFDERDLALAEEVGRRAGTAIQNARLYGERAEIARTLQDSLLPPHLPEIPGVEIAARYHAAGEGIQVGGDFYDLFPLADGSWAVIIGDVCGKGSAAAAITALARYTLRAAAMRERDPGRILATLNEALLRQRDDRQFCTVAYAALKPGDGVADLVVARGGHPQPYVVRADGRVEPVGARGTLLGVVPDPEFRAEAVRLGPGDSLLLYTDGVTEARVDGELFGNDRLMEVASRAAGLGAAELARRVEEAATSADLRDDAAILAVRVETREDPPPATVAERGTVVEVGLPAEPGAVAEARAALGDLAGALPEHKLDDLRLLVSEVVTNALRHGDAAGRGTIPFVARLDESLLRVEVSDAGPGFDPASRPARSADAKGGFGLTLVSRLASRWGCLPGRGDARGSTVWFEFDLAT